MRCDPCRPVASIKKRGARSFTYGSQSFKNACAAENFAKMALKSAIFELQKSFRHKFLSTINFLKNETGKNVF